MNDGLLQVVKPMRSVAADYVAIADNPVGRAQHPSVHGDQSLDHFEDAARTVGRTQRSIEERLVWVVDEAVVVRTAVPSGQQVGSVTRCADHRKDFPCRRLNGNDGTALVSHDVFSVGLQFQIQRQLNIITGHREGVEHAGLGWFTEVVSDVDDVVPGTASSAQRGFPLQLQTGLPLVVAEPVALIGREVVLVHFAEFAQQVARESGRIGTKGSPANLNAREAPHFAGYPGIALCSELFLNARGPVGCVILGAAERACQPVGCHFNQLCQNQSVEPSGSRAFAGCEPNVVTGFVVDDNLTVAVTDEAAGRFECFRFFGQPGSICFPLVSKHLHLD